MKAVILNDTHFGFKNDSCIILDYFLEFFDEQLFPYLKEHNIKTIFHLGDVFDRRNMLILKPFIEFVKSFWNHYKTWALKSTPSVETMTLTTEIPITSIHYRNWLHTFQTGQCTQSQRIYISQWGVLHSYHG